MRHKSIYMLGLISLLFGCSTTEPPAFYETSTDGSTRSMLSRLKGEKDASVAAQKVEDWRTANSLFRKCIPVDASVPAAPSPITGASQPDASPVKLVDRCTGETRSQLSLHYMWTGKRMIDALCERYFNSALQAQRLKEASAASVNRISNLLVALQAAGKVGSPVVAATSIGANFFTGSEDDLAIAVLPGPDLDILHTLVVEAQQRAWSTVQAEFASPSFGYLQAEDALQKYAYACSFPGMKHVLNDTLKNGKDPAALDANARAIQTLSDKLATQAALAASAAEYANTAVKKAAEAASRATEAASAAAAANARATQAEGQVASTPAPAASAASK
jgi:hypothetical protein